jgi:NADH:ubiquinone reductase (H+-translocating)
MEKIIQSRRPNQNQIQNYDTLPHVVIIGAGFGGLRAAHNLGKAPVKVTVIDRTNHHLFQPLLYQVATATLSPGEITAPIRYELRKNQNTEVIMGEITNIDVQAQRVWMHNHSLSYDYLIVATGSHENYFGHDEWRAFSRGLKTIEDARAIRNQIFQAFEQAEMETDSELIQELLTFVIIGAGPTGVELAGDIADIVHRVLPQEFRHINPSMARIILVEAMDRILLAFPEQQARDTLKRLKKLGIEVKLNSPVTAVDKYSVTAGDTTIHTRTILWTAGVQAAPPVSWLEVPMDRSKRVQVMGDLSIPGHPNVFVIGDSASYLQNGKPLPAVAPVALQEGSYVAQLITERVTGNTETPHKKLPPTFRYVDKGNMTTAGRGYGILQIGKLQLTGFLAWLIWLAVHIFNLINFENRVVVMLQWIWAYVAYQRRVRLITPSIKPIQETKQITQKP